MFDACSRGIMLCPRHYTSDAKLHHRIQQSRCRVGSAMMAFRARPLMRFVHQLSNTMIPETEYNPR